MEFRNRDPEVRRNASELARGRHFRHLKGSNLQKNQSTSYFIDELEPVKRGIYGGACGYLSYAGDMDVAIAIRTAVIKDQTLHVQAAAGVVADSVPEMEWRETEQKARALLRASELVEEGLE